MCVCCRAAPPTPPQTRAAYVVRGRDGVVVTRRLSRVRADQKFTRKKRFGHCVLKLISLPVRIIPIQRTSYRYSTNLFKPHKTQIFLSLSSFRILIYDKICYRALYGVTTLFSLSLSHSVSSSQFAYLHVLINLLILFRSTFSNDETSSDDDRTI